MFVNRRQFTSGAVAAAGIGAATDAFAKTPREPIVATRSGKVRGLLEAGVYRFKGIP